MRFTTSLSAALVAVSCSAAYGSYDGPSYALGSQRSHGGSVYARNLFDDSFEEPELMEREVVENYLFARAELEELVAREKGAKEVKEGKKLEKSGHEKAGKATVKAGKKKEKKTSKRSVEDFDDEDIMDLIMRAHGVGEVKEGLKLEKNGHKAAGKAAVRAGEKKEAKAAKGGK